MRGPPELIRNQDPSMAYKSQLNEEHRNVDFSEFMWMQGEEEFDRRVIEELLHEDSSSESEAFLDDVLEPDELAWYYNNVPAESNDALATDMEELSLSGSRFIQYTHNNTNQLPVITQELNPNAPVFVPGGNDGSGEGHHINNEGNPADPSEELQSDVYLRLNPEAPEFVPRDFRTESADKEEER